MFWTCHLTVCLGYSFAPLLLDGMPLLQEGLHCVLSDTSLCTTVGC
jgi:hypothetical protein